MDIINKELDKEDDLEDMKIHLSLFMIGNLLLLGLLIFVKWSVLATGKVNIKLCKHVDDNFAAETFTYRMRVII